MTKPLDREVEQEQYKKGFAAALDMIRAEIEQLTITEGSENYIREMAELYSLKIKVLQIIDKCKVESNGGDPD